MIDIELEHILLFVIVAFMLYYFVGRGCGCSGFRVGGQNRKSLMWKKQNYNKPQKSNDKYIPGRVKPNSLLGTL